MAEYTLTFDSDLNGWVSFYSFFPEKIIGMNNYLYTFKNAKLYRHNVNDVRNNFYGTQYTSKVTSVVNQSPLFNKVFKAFYLESDDIWEADFNTDVIAGFIQGKTTNPNVTADPYWWKKKESDWFAFIRTDVLPASGSGTSYAPSPDLQLRSVNGIGQINTPSSGPANATVLTFGSEVQLSPVFIQPRDSATLLGGDLLYYFAPTTPPAVTFTPIPIGVVVSINNTNKEIVVDTTAFTPALPIPPGSLIVSVKNSEAESNGLLGHYLEFTLENSNIDAVELFAVAADAMMSEPNPRSK